VDICGALTDSPDSGAYWRKLKQRLKAEGSEAVTICHGLKLIVGDARVKLEIETGVKVVTLENYLTEPENRKRLKAKKREDGKP
jgi:hypothetical protein